MTTERNIIIHQGQAFALSLDYAGTAGRGQRMHIRLADSTATVVQILTHNGDANARVIFDTDALEITIGASVSAGWVVLADRVEWVYDIEDYDLADEDDCVIPYRGKVIARGNRTRASDVTPSEQMPSGDGRYVRFDGVQGLSAEQQLQARDNIGAGTGGGGAGTWGSITGTLTDQNDLVTALGLKAPLASPTLTGTPAAPTAAGGTSTTQIATTAFVGGEITTHAAATDPHGDRAFATSAVSTHAALTTGAHGITAAGAALLDDADAAAQRTTLGLGTAATQASSAFEASGAIATHNAVTTAHGISAYGATLVDDADAATARTTLGLGTAATTAATDYATASHNHSGVYQPADAELTAIAGLTSAADSAPYFTGSGTAALMTVTSAGRALIDDADASAQRTTLGLTALATTTPGTGVATALGVNVGSAGAVVTNGGALGTPSSGTLTNCTFPAISGLVGFTSAESTSSPNATIPVASLSPSNAATNVDAALSPKGTGAVLADVPDSAASGGNKRGANAVDLQTNRSAATEVASGANSALLGGRTNTASGESAVAAGAGNTASGARAIAFGTSCTASGATSVAAGSGNIASALGANAFGGSDNTASGVNSWTPGGNYGLTRGIVGAGAYAASRRTGQGDRQTMLLPISCAARTDATPTVMTSDAGAASATNQMALPNNSSMFFEVDVVAHDASLKSASWKVQGTIRRGANAAATAIVGTNVTTTFGSDLSGGSPGVTCTADTTNGALQVTFTGIAATTIYPSGHIRTVIAA